MKMLPKFIALAVFGIAGLGFAQQALAWSTESNSTSGNFANLTDPDEQQPALVNSGNNVNPNPGEQDMDRIANEGHAPQIVGPSSLHTGFGSFGPTGQNYYGH